MKKFGTPSGAGPGSEKEKVGFEAVGTPPDAAGGGGFEGCFALADLCVGIDLVPDFGLLLVLGPEFLFWELLFCLEGEEGGFRCEGWRLLPGELEWVGLCEVGVRDGVVVVV